MYYHYLTVRERRPNVAGCVEVNRVIGSAAVDADEAWHERSKIAAEYHPDQIVCLSTHLKGTGPACGGGMIYNGPES